MAGQPPQPKENLQKNPRDAAYWAQGVKALKISEVPEGAVNLNVEGRRVVGPLQGFGRMWQKTYRIPLEGSGATPAEVVKVWKERFPEFWMPGNRFLAPKGGLAPGAVALINSDVPGSRWFSTGVMVLYSDEESFTYMTPEGHPFSGWITFSSYADDEGTTVAQAQLIIRANDPLYELMMPVGLHRIEDRTWQHTLRSLASYFGTGGKVESRVTCLDPRRQWSQAGNIRYNALIWSMIYAVLAPMRPRRERKPTN